MANENIKVIADKEDIVAIADAIRTVSGETESMSLADMPTKIVNAGSGGGGSVETCTVTISFKNRIPNYVYITGTQLINDNIQPYTFISDTTNLFPTSLTINNIVKSSAIVVSGFGQYTLGARTYTGCVELWKALGISALAAHITESVASITISNDF